MDAIDEKIKKPRTPGTWVSVSVILDCLVGGLTTQQSVVAIAACGRRPRAAFTLARGCQCASSGLPRALLPHMMELCDAPMRS